jgi:hypothetical protein
MSFFSASISITQRCCHPQADTVEAAFRKFGWNQESAQRLKLRTTPEIENGWQISATS